MKIGMSSRIVASGFLGVAAFVPACVSSALADTGIETVVVTAEKVQENANDVGMSITALSGDQLIQNGITDPAQLVKAVPGLTYTKSGYGQPVYTLRGVGYYDTAMNASPDVSIYLDEVPLPFSAMTRGISFDVQRVEVLKGPQGTLFGENATGGAINYIANKPTDTFSAGADLGYSSYSEVTGAAFISGPLTDTLNGRIAVNVDEGGAWQQSFTRPNDDHGATRLIAGRLLLDWQPMNALSFELNVNGWQDTSDTQAGQALAIVSAAPSSALLAFFGQYPIPPRNAREADWDPGVPTGTIDPIVGAVNDGLRVKNRFVQTSLRGNYDFGNNITLTSITAWEHLTEKSLVDTDGMAIQTFSVSTGGSLDTFSQELRLSGSYESGLHWVVGGNYESDHMFNYGDPFSTLSTFPFPVSGAIAHTRVSTLAAFAHANYPITDTLQLEGGIRYTDVRIHNSGCTIDGGDGKLSAIVTTIAAARGVTITSPPAGGCITLDAQTFQPGYVIGQLYQNNVPWTVGLDWKVTPDTLLYATVGRGFKAGDFSPAGAIFSSSLSPATQESLLSYEIGFKAAGLNDGRLQVTGAAFYYDYSNKQIRGKLIDPILGSLNKLLNIPKSKIKGAELNIAWVPIDSLLFNVGASYTNSKIVNHFTNFTVLGVLQDMDGEALPLTPKWHLVADGEYNFPVTPDFQGFLGAHLTYQSSSNSGLGAVPLFQNDAYTNLDLRIGVRACDSRWVGTFFIDNVTDEYSWNFVNLSGPDMVSRYANPPRIFGIRLSYRN